MTRRTIDIDDEVWRYLRIVAAQRGVTVKELVHQKLTNSGAYLPPHMEVSGVCQRCGEVWPCPAALLASDDVVIRK